MVAFDGSCARLAKQPTKTPTLLEAHGCGEQSTAHQYCEAIHRHVNLDREHPYFLPEMDMLSVMAAKHVIPGWSRFTLWS